MSHRYLTGVDATLRNMRISTTILKRIFVEFPVLIQEIADVFIPQIFFEGGDRIKPTLFNGGNIICTVYCDRISFLYPIIYRHFIRFFFNKQTKL